MKRFSFLLAILAIVLVFGLTLASCGGGDDGTTTPGGNQPSEGTPSTLVVTGIPSTYYGKYAMVQGDSASGLVFLGFQSMSIAEQNYTLIPISNASISAPLVVASTGFPYDGNELAHVAIGIYAQQTHSQEDDAIAVIRFMSVPFTNGGATVVWANGNVTEAP